VNIFIAVIIFSLLSAAVIKHIAYILIYGSVFEPLRLFFREKSRTWGLFGWFFRNMSGLFSCNLCMVTQLSILLFVLPCLVFIHNIIGLENVVAEMTGESISQQLSVTTIIFATLWLSFFTASLSMFYWNISEFKVEKFNKQRLHYEKLLEKAYLSKNSENNVTPILMPTDLREIIEHIENKCWWIDCPFRKSDCFDEKTRVWLEEWGEKNQVDQPLTFLDPVRRSVRTYLWNKTKDDHENNERLSTLYQELIEMTS